MPAKDVNEGVVRGLGRSGKFRFVGSKGGARGKEWSVITVQ